jgi:hypothetical protein
MAVNTNQKYKVVQKFSRVLSSSIILFNFSSGITSPSGKPSKKVPINLVIFDQFASYEIGPSYEILRDKKRREASGINKKKKKIPVQDIENQLHLISVQ